MAVELPKTGYLTQLTRASAVWTVWNGGEKTSDAVVQIGTRPGLYYHLNYAGTWAGGNIAIAAWVGDDDNGAWVTNNASFGQDVTADGHQRVPGTGKLRFTLTGTTSVSLDVTQEKSFRQ